MSARPSDQAQDSKRKFAPSVNPLESRLLLSRQVPFPDGTSFSFPTFMRLPRTGGALIQSGKALTVGVGQRTSNTVNIAEEGGGAAAVEWNGLPQHSITGVQAVLVQAGTAAHDKIKINLTGSAAVAGAMSVPAFEASATAPGHASPASHAVNAVRGPRTGGTAVQIGTVLTISVTARKINAVTIESWNSGQMVQAEWNGGDQHSFTGVSTIIVDVRNGSKDFVALDNVVAEGP
jgi:hypothetical protein